MPTPTKPAPGKASKKPPKNTTQPVPAEEAPAYSPSTDRRSLEAILARRGQVDADHRAAYDNLISDVDRAVLGTQTKAAGVFREAVAWSIQIDKAYTDYPAVVGEHYSPQRFQYYLDRTAALGEQLVAEAERRGAGTGTRTSASDREKLARDKRDVLIDKLRGVAGQRRTEKATLNGATGQTGTAELLGKSIANLVDLGRKWLALKDPTSVILCRSAGLTAAVIEEAMQGAEALTGAATDAQLSGRLAGNDSPQVNILEGTVLHEMDEAERCFRNMRKKSPVIARLVPGNATRHVLGVKKGAYPADEPETGGATPPA